MADCTVWLAPDDGSPYHVPFAGTGAVKQGIPQRGGTIAVAPGAYRVMAWEKCNWTWADPQSVVVRPHEITTVDLGYWTLIGCTGSG